MVYLAQVSREQEIVDSLNDAIFAIQELREENDLLHRRISLLTQLLLPPESWETVDLNWEMWAPEADYAGDVSRIRVNLPVRSHLLPLSVPTQITETTTTIWDRLAKL